MTRTFIVRERTKSKIVPKDTKKPRSVPVFGRQFHQGTGNRRLVVPMPGGADAVMAVGDDQVDALAALAPDQQDRREGLALPDVLQRLVNFVIVLFEQMGLAGAQYVLGFELDGGGLAQAFDDQPRIGVAE